VSIVENPYLPRAYFLKGELHCHTTNSDGLQTPTDVETAYRNAGYDFIFITDHDYLTPDPNVANILHIDGVEESPTEGHINNLGGAKESLETDFQKIINDIREVTGIAQINHPNRAEPVGFTIEELLTLKDYRLIEIYNRKSDVTYGLPPAEDMWDTLLSKGVKCWGVASADTHDVTDPNIFPNKAFVIVFADELSKSAIMDALKTGNFISSAGIEKLEVRVVNNTITVKTDAPSKIVWIRKDGVSFRTKLDTLEDSYIVKGDEGYIRVRIERSSEKSFAWTNPIFVEEVPAPILPPPLIPPPIPPPVYVIVVIGLLIGFIFFILYVVRGRL